MNKVGAPSCSRSLREGGALRGLSVTKRILGLCASSRPGVFGDGPTLTFCVTAGTAKRSRGAWHISDGLSSRPELLIPEGDEKRSGGTLCFAHEQQRIRNCPSPRAVWHLSGSPPPRCQPKIPALSPRTREGQGTRGLRVELRHTLHYTFLLRLRQFRKHGKREHFVGGAF